MTTKKKLWEDLQAGPSEGKRNSRMGRVPTVKFLARSGNMKRASRRRTRLARRWNARP